MEKTVECLDDKHLVKFIGRFTFVDHGTFKEVVDELLKDNCKHCVLDLSGLEFVDSAGLGMLLIIKDELAKKSATLILKSPTGQVEKMLQVSHFDQMFTIES